MGEIANLPTPRLPLRPESEIRCPGRHSEAVPVTGNSRHSDLRFCSPSWQRYPHLSHLCDLTPPTTAPETTVCLLFVCTSVCLNQPRPLCRPTDPGRTSTGGNVSWHVTCRGAASCALLCHPSPIQCRRRVNSVSVDLRGARKVTGQQSPSGWPSSTGSIGCHLAVIRMPPECHLAVTWLSSGCQPTVIWSLAATPT